MNLFLRENWQHLALAGIAALVSFDFIRMPFTNDVNIFMGVANIADRFYPFPQGIDLAWEAKPIGNRIINYLLLKGAEVFAPFENAVDFAMAAKIIALLVLVIIAAYIVFVLGGTYTFWLVFFTFTACCNFCVMQAEWWAVLLSLLALACLMHDSPYAAYLAGFLFIFIGMIKGITFFLFVPVVCCVYLLGKPQQNAAMKVLAASAATTMAVIAAQLTIWPNMLSDLLLTPIITGVGRLGLDDLLLLSVGQGILAMFYIPVLIAGLGAMSILAVSGYFGDRKTLTLFAISWVVPIVLVLVHSEFFAYQFLVYAIPALTVVLLALRRFEANGKSRHAGLLVVAVMLVTFLMFNSSAGTMGKIENDFFRQQLGYVDKIQEQFHINEEKSVLYLEAGVAPYYLQANSSSRYICPLPYQRDAPEWDLAGNYAFQQVQSDILTYQGTYIIYEGDSRLTAWIHSEYPNRQPLLQKLDHEYHIVWTEGWTIYKRKDTNHSS